MAIVRWLFRHQTIDFAHDYSLAIGLQENQLQLRINKNTRNYIHENAFVVCKIWTTCSGRNMLT